MGEAVERLEPLSAEYTGTRFAVGYGSRTDALFLALPRPWECSERPATDSAIQLVLPPLQDFARQCPACCCRCPAGRGGSIAPRRARRSLSTRAGPSLSARGRSRSIGAQSVPSFCNRAKDRQRGAMRTR